MSTFNLKTKIEAILKPFAKAVGADIKAILASIKGFETKLADKQDKLRQGTGVNIAEDGTISVNIDNVNMDDFAKKAETQVKLVAPEDGSITVAEDGHIALAAGFVKETDLALDGLEADLLAAYKEGKGDAEAAATTDSHAETGSPTVAG